MLSDETTVGNYPKEAVETLYKTAKIVLENSHSLKERKSPQIMGEYEAIAQSTVELANNLKAKAIVSFSKSGRSIQAICKHRPMSPIWIISSQEQTLLKSTLYWGVQKAILVPNLGLIDQKIEYFLKTILSPSSLLEKDDTYILTMGYNQGLRAFNTIYVLSYGEIQILKEHYGI